MTLKIKQVVVINNDLKMSKGKVARVCLMLGFGSKYILGSLQNVMWIRNNYKAVVLKASFGEYLNILKYLKDNKIRYKEHVDAGLTQVPAHSRCGLVCYLNDDEEITKELKLY